MAEKVDRVVVAVVGCLGVFVVALVVAVGGAVLWLRPRTAGTAPSSGSTTEASSGAPEQPVAPSPLRRPWEPIPAEPCTGTPSAEGAITEPLRVHDPGRVDLAEVYDQVRPLALRLEPDARLVTISSLEPAKDGAFDSGSGNFSFNYEFRCLRAGAPPGLDLHQGMLLVFVRGGTVQASRVPVEIAPTLTYRGALSEPPCSTVAAWTTVVASGVPSDARASFLYTEATGSVGGASWLITVAGHPFRREVNGETCRLRAGSAIHPDLVDPGVTLPDLHPTAPEAPSAAPDAPSAAPSAEPAAEPHIGFGGALEWERPVEAADMSAVDVAALVPQARVIAEKLQPGARFTGLTAFETTHGKVDLTGEARIVYKFEFVGHDASQPPGKDAIERAIDVTAKRGVLHGSRRDWPASQLKALGGAMEPPTCTSAQAWATATNSGVPDDAVAMLLYYDSTPFKPGGPWVWSVRVAGHDEHRREIDSKTCALLRNWNPSPSAPASRAAPPGSSAAPAKPVVAAESGSCTLNLNSIPVSQLSLDGRPIGSSPKVGLAVSCGQHVVTFTHPEKGRKSISVYATSGRPATAAVKF